MSNHRWTANSFGIGTDIERIDRFTQLDQTQDSALLNKIFTSNELEYCFSKGKTASHLAARYSGKEAIVKAVNSMGRTNLNYSDIEILNDKNGVPLARIGKAGFDDLKIHLSLSHCRDTAIAFAVVIETKRMM